MKERPGQNHPNHKETYEPTPETGNLTAIENAGKSEAETPTQERLRGFEECLRESEKNGQEALERSQALLNQVEVANIPAKKKAELVSKVIKQGISASRFLRVGVLILAAGALSELHSPDRKTDEIAGKKIETARILPVQPETKETELEVDAQTEHVLRVLSGEEELNNQEMETMIRSHIKDFLYTNFLFAEENIKTEKDPERILEYKKQKREYEKKMKGMDSIPLKECAKLDIFKNSYTFISIVEGAKEYEAKEITYDDMLRKIFKDLKGSDPKLTLGNENENHTESSKQYYTSSRQLLVECGAPNVRFRLANPDYQPGQDVERSFFDHSNNTIGLDFPGNHLVAELAHAKQYSMRPGHFRSLADNFEPEQVRWEQERQGIKSYGEAYDKTMYERYGTLEFEGHKEIQPLLEKRLDEIRKGRAKPPISIKNPELFYEQEEQKMSDQHTRETVTRSFEYADKYRKIDDLKEKKKINREADQKYKESEKRHWEKIQNFRREFWQNYVKK